MRQLVVASVGLLVRQLAMRSVVAMVRLSGVHWVRQLEPRSTQRKNPVTLPRRQKCITNTVHLLEAILTTPIAHLAKGKKVAADSVGFCSSLLHCMEEF